MYKSSLSFLFLFHISNDGNWCVTERMRLTQVLGTKQRILVDKLTRWLTRLTERHSFQSLARWAPRHTDDSSSLRYRQAKASRTRARFHAFPNYQHDLIWCTYQSSRGGDPKHGQLRRVCESELVSFIHPQQKQHSNGSVSALISYSATPVLVKEEIKCANVGMWSVLR